MRRTPTLTKQARDMFEDLIKTSGFAPGVTVPAIARETGLSKEQVRDALFSPSADEWRRGFAARLREVH